jgi:hypothetical protein
MPLFKRDSGIAIVTAAGIVQVTVKPRFHPLLFIVEGGALAAFIFFGWNRGLVLFRAQPLLFSFLVLAIATSIWHQLSGSEEIEFDGQKQTLVIRRNVLGWLHTREFAFSDLSALEPRYGEDDESNPDGLRFKAGARTITFAKGINADQADRVIAAVQDAMPEAAHRLLSENDPFDQHFTTLNLR